jgi:hypothetical protein
MITHLIYEDWLDWVPAIAFALVFGVFAFSLLRLWRMDSHQADHAARLPLETDSPRPNGENTR